MTLVAVSTVLNPALNCSIFVWLTLFSLFHFNVFSLEGFEGNFEGGELVDRHAKVHYFDGSKYEGGMLDGQKHFFGKITKGCPNRTIQAKFKNGSAVLSETLLIKYPNGNKYQGQLNDREMKHGKGVMEYNNGEKYDGDWENDKKCGFG